jgi:hypothetical protein
LIFFWLMALLPSESQQPDGRLSLVWTMVYALAAAFAFGFFNDDVVGRWYPELNEGAQAAGAVLVCFRRPLLLLGPRFSEPRGGGRAFRGGTDECGGSRGGRSADGDLLRHEASALPPEQRPRGMISC